MKPLNRSIKRPPTQPDNSKDDSRKSHFLRTVATALALMAAGSCEVRAAASATYSITNLGLPSATYDQLGEALRYDDASPTGINESGQIAGRIFFSSTALLIATGNPYGYHSFVWDNGVMTDLEPHSESSSASGINDTGTVVGSTTLDRQVAVVWQNGERFLLEPEETIQSSAGLAINQLGHVVGYSGGGFVIWHDGVKTSLGIDGFAPTDINDANDLCGYVFDGSGFIASGILQAGVLTLISPLGSDAGYLAVEVYAMNDAGEAVGLSSHSDNTYHAFVWRNGATIDLGALGVHPTTYTESSARAINDRGQVVGYSTTATGGNNHGFLWEDVNGNGLSDPGEMADLNTLLPPNSGVEILAASWINNQGQIVGSAIFGAGDAARRGGFVMTPLTPTELTQNLSEAVTALVQTGVSLPADGQSLVAKLKAAQQHITTEDLTAARNELGAFINQIEAFVGTRKLTSTQGQALIEDARAVISALRR